MCTILLWLVESYKQFVRTVRLNVERGSLVLLSVAFSDFLNAIYLFQVNLFSSRNKKMYFKKKSVETN